MSHPQGQFLRAEFADMVATELDDYYSALGTRFERLFYFPGQDPFGQDSPADAISSLYWGLPRQARSTMSLGLIDVLASRMELVRPQALCQVVLAIGLIHDVKLLQPLVQVVGQRRDNIESLRAIYASTVAVIIGFGPIQPALEAARELSNFELFPDDLVYDVLEFLVRDPMTPWYQSVTQLLPRMDADYRPSEYSRIQKRLTFVAEEIGARVGLKKLADGVLALIGKDVNDVYSHRFLPRRDPLGILLAELLLEPNAPFLLKHRPSGELMIANKDGKQNLTVEGDLVFHVLEKALSSIPVSIHFLAIAEEVCT